MKKGIIFLSLALVLNACYYDNEEDLYGIDCDTSNVTFAKDIDKIVQSSCATTNCHDGGSQQTKYDSYQSVFQDSGKIFERVIVEKDMPPGETLTDCDFEKMEIWLRNGAL